MSTPAILVESLGKRYWIGHQAPQRYMALRDILAKKTRDLASGALGRSASLEGHPKMEEFWALRDVSFEVGQGEVIGIIGRNGAGKSTLLKILSRITEPTLGKITIDGRVASLLEVGTGFHPELTGRENIFLNGAILGMQRREILRKFDEIVAFAEVEKFLDTPVKRYSSGMYMRLAFAVAAHLEPEIMLVDEVLAVGDAGFQKKCLGKMSEVATAGRTVFFVSHNMGAVSKLCQKGIVLDRGRVAYVGDKTDAIDFYLKSLTGPESHASIGTRSDRKGNGFLRMVDFSFVDDESAEPRPVLACSEPLCLRIRYESRGGGFAGRFMVGIYNSLDICPIFLDSHVDAALPSRFPPKGEITIRLSPEFALVPGIYNVNVAAFANGEMADYVVGALSLEVTQGDFFGSGKFPEGKSQCYVRNRWSIREG